MSKVDPPPSPEEMQKRRLERPWILDPKELEKKDIERVRSWAGEIMLKNESKLSTKVPNRKRVASGEVDPEEIDIRAIYPFQELNWLIYRDDVGSNVLWGFLLLSGGRLLCKIHYAKI